MALSKDLKNNKITLKNIKKMARVWLETHKNGRPQYVSWAKEILKGGVTKSKAITILKDFIGSRSTNTHALEGLSKIYQQAKTIKGSGNLLPNPKNPSVTPSVTGAKKKPVVPLPQTGPVNPRRSASSRQALINFLARAGEQNPKKLTPRLDKWFGPVPFLGPKGPVGDRPFPMPGRVRGEQGKLFNPEALEKGPHRRTFVGGSYKNRPLLQADTPIKGQKNIPGLFPQYKTPIGPPPHPPRFPFPPGGGPVRPFSGMVPPPPGTKRPGPRMSIPKLPKKLSGWKKALKLGGRGLNVLFLAYMLYDILRATGGFGAQREKDRTLMAGIEGLQMPQAAALRRKSFDMSNFSRDVEAMEENARLGEGRQKAAQFTNMAMSGKLAGLMANNRALRGSASLMHPAVQNQLQNLSLEGII